MTTSWAENWLPVALLAATLLVLLLLAVVVSAALRGGGAAGSGAAAKTMRLLGVQSLQRSFRRAVKLIEANLAPGTERYNLSWTLLLNGSASADVPLHAAGIASALADDSGLDAAGQGIAWNFFDKGLVVQLRTASLGETGSAGRASGNADGVWDQFLELCRHYRPLRPFDAIVLAVPAATLFVLDQPGELAVVARAQALHRRLWLAQNRLALRFPIHVVVTECECIPGFARFAAALPAPLRRSMLGWASPHELVAPYRSAWVDSAIDQVVGATADACAELCAIEQGDQDSSDYFLLPTELERLRRGLTLFCDELMRPSAYHESFLLRGIYLTGDSSAAAVLQGAAGGAGVPLAAAAPVAAGQPAFLRDIFERKVFAEVGIVRATRQRLRRPATRWLGNLAVALPLLVWGIGLVVAAARLREDRDDLLTWLAPAPQAAQAPGVPAGAGPRAAATMQQFDRLAAIDFYSVTMPGSWPAFSAVDRDFHVLVQHAFAHQAVLALRRGARSRTEELVGPVAGPCTLSPGGSDPGAVAPAAAIDIGDLPDFRRIKAQPGQLNELDLATQALDRLGQAGPEPASGADLTLAMRGLVDHGMPAARDDTAALYRAESMTPPSIAFALPAGAGACKLLAVGQRLYDRLYHANPLLAEEQAIGQALHALRSSGAVDPVRRMEDWRDLQRALAAERMLLAQARGHGAWMHATGFTLDPVQGALFASVRKERLLGPDAAGPLKAMAQSGWAGFQSDWAAALAAAVDDSGRGLAWDGNAWVFTVERQKLADGVDALLAPAFMTIGSAPELATVPDNMTVRWDKTLLDRAAALFEQRKAFLAGPAAALPATLQAGAGAVADAQLTAAVRTLLAQAMTTSGAELPGPAADAARASVAAIRDQLRDLGATVLAGQIDAVLVADAGTRLRRIDALFDAYQPYQVRDLQFSQWDGQKGVLFDAFGVADLAGLNLYLEQQRENVDAMDAQASGVLGVLASATPAGAVPAPLVATWQAIHKEVLRSNLKSPLSSRLALENFVRAASTDIALPNCVDKLGPRPQGKAAPDVFAVRLRALQDGLYQRCRILADAFDQRQWQDFATAWNHDLGARAPFAAQSGAVPADHAAVGAILKLYDGTQTPGLLARAAVRPFDTDLRRLRALLGPLFPDDESEVGALDVAVDFRANSQGEHNAAQIIAWSLTIGTETRRPGDKPVPMRWEPRMPVKLELRVAKNGGMVPQLQKGAAGVSVNGPTVTYLFDDPWALFTFIKANRRLEAGGDDARGPLLGFAFGLVPAPGAAPGGQDDDALAFLRLHLSSPGKLTPLAWPAALPAVLPTVLSTRLPLSLDTAKNAL